MIAEDREQAERRADFDAVADARYERIGHRSGLPWRNEMLAIWKGTWPARQRSAPLRANWRALVSSAIELAPELAEDFVRILDHLTNHEDPGQRIGEIIAALEILVQNPVDRSSGGEMQAQLVAVVHMGM